MTYFIEVTEYQTYANAEADFPMIRGNSHHRQY